MARRRNKKVPATRKHVAGKKKIRNTVRKTRKRISKQKQSLIGKLISALKERIANLRRKKNKKSKPKNEFRFNMATGHPNYIFGETEDKYQGLGLTHKATTFGRKNMELHKNPKEGETEKSFVRNGIVVNKKKYYSAEPLPNYHFANEDKPNIKSKIRNYKRRQKEIRRIQREKRRNQKKASKRSR